MRCADANAVPGRSALAVDRRFAAAVTTAIAGHPHVELRHELGRIPGEGLVLVATGPM
jgi:folate-dependent tRNA-U54 methylase TrmFO/GidA